MFGEHDNAEGVRGASQSPPGNKKIFFEQVKMLAHIYYLFIYVLTDTKNSNFCVMKVKDFIDWVRPITALDPETDLFISDLRDEQYKLDKLLFSKDDVTIFIEKDF